MKGRLESAVLYACVMGIEACWFYVFLELLNLSTGGKLLTFGLMVILPASFIFNRLLGGLKWHRLLLRWISWGVWLIAVMLTLKVQSGLAWQDYTWLLALPRAIVQLPYTFKPELLILLGSALLWLSGRRLANLSIDFSTLVAEFQFGLSVLLIFLFLASKTGHPVAYSVLITVIFFFFALSGMAYARENLFATWRRSLWSWVLVTSIGAIVGLGFLTSAVINHQLLNVILTGIRWAGGLVWGLIMKVVIYLSSLIPHNLGELPNSSNEGQLQNVYDNIYKFFTMPELLRRSLELGLDLIWIGLFLAALWRVSTQIFGWARSRPSHKIESKAKPSREPIWITIFAFFKRIWQRLFPFPAKSRKSKTGSVPAEIYVRQTYRRLLHWANVAGYPRQKSETPDEYLAALGSLIPEARGDLGLITEQYISTRYGLLLPTEGSLSRLRQSWFKIKKTHLKFR